MKRLVQRVTNPWVLGVAAALALYALAGFLLLPYLVRHYVPKLADEQLRCQAAVAEVRFNPFLFEFEAKDFSFKDAAGEAIFGFQRLFVDFDLESLFRWAWTFADIRLEGWSADLVIDREGRLNLAKIAAALPESDEASPPAEHPPRLLLKHVALTGGSVKFTDRSKSTPVSETVSPIDVEFDAISTLPEHRGSHVVSAKLANGGALEWKGHVSLNPILSEGEVRLEGFNLATPWNFIREQLDLAEPLGDMDATARYRFRYDQAKADLTVNDVAVKLKGLRLSTPSASEPILVLDTTEVAGARFNLATRELTVPTFNVRNGRIVVSVDEKGIANWETLVKTGTTDAPQPTPPGAGTSAGAPEAPWRVKLEAFKVADVGITYADASHAVPSVVSVGAFKLGFGAEVESGSAAPKTRIRDLTASLERIAIAERDKGDPLASLDSIKVEGGQMDLEKREATIQQVVLQNGGAKIARDANHTIRWLELFGPRDQANAHPQIDVTEMENEEEGSPWRFALKALDLQGFHIALADQSISPEVAYDIEDMKVALKDITNDGQTAIAFDVQLKIKQGGALSTTGQLSQKADRAEAQVKIEGMNLTPLKSLVAQIAALTLESAAVSGDIRVDYSQAKTGPSLKAAGAFSLDKLLLNESKGAKPFLSWKALSADGIDFGLGPDKISIKEVRLVEPDTKIVIFKDQTLNLAAAFQQQAAPSSRQPAKKEKQKSDPANPFPVTVERVRIERAKVDFADLSLVLPFAARIHELSGAATGISSAPTNRTRLQLEGRVDEFGEVNVEGSLSPLQLEKFSDVKVIFRNVAMPPLSPYSGTFAGRRIKSGKLNLDLEYKLEDRKVKSNNTVVLDQFTLGERVESPKAVDLPLDLAIALLTDSEGKINASVPIEGDVDHPEFSVGHLIWQAIVNLITSAVTAPFKALGAIVGGEEEGIDAILFRPGIDKLPPSEREKLAKVAQALAKRPKLALTVHGSYDPAADGEALRSMQVRRALAQELDVELQPDEDPGPVAVDNAETQRALEALSDEREGEDAIEEFEASYEKSEGKKSKRVSAVLSLMGQASEDVDFYEKLFQHLVEKAPLAKGDLEALAVRRATAVIKDLTGQAGFDPSRATAGKIEEVRDTRADSVPTKLELGALER
jgi:hypothetical protein